MENFFNISATSKRSRLAFEAETANQTTELTPPLWNNSGAFEMVSRPFWTLLVGRGEIGCRDMVATIRTHYPRMETKDVVWDLSEGSLDTMSRRDFELIAKTVKIHGNLRHNAKTAFVGSSSETYALSCMYVAITGLLEVPVDYSVFFTREEAERWMVADNQCNSTVHGLHPAGEAVGSADHSESLCIPAVRDIRG